MTAVFLCTWHVLNAMPQQYDRKLAESTAKTGFVRGLRVIHMISCYCAADALVQALCASGIIVCSTDIDQEHEV